MTITCGEHVYKVHKFILVTRGGSFFERAICSGFSETQSSTIDLPDDDPDTIASLLQHVYTGSYAQTAPIEDRKIAEQREKVETPSNPNGLETVVQCSMPHVRMFAAAVKFGIDTLREEARKTFMKAFNGALLDTRFLSEVPNGISTLVSAVYATTPAQERDLRDCLVFEAHSEWTHFQDEAGGENATAHLNILREVPELALDVLTYRMRAESNSWTCKKCKAAHPWAFAPCKCGVLWKHCEEPRCVKQQSAASQCLGCFRKGTLAPSKKSDK